MNRSLIGDILKAYGLQKGVFKHNGGVYHVYSKPADWGDVHFRTNFVTVKNFTDIYLHTNEVCIIGVGNLEVNIPYIYLDLFEIFGEDVDADLSKLWSEDDLCV